MTRKPESKMTASECLARITGGDIIQSYRIPFRILVQRAFGLNRRPQDWHPMSKTKLKP
jgi:hypothetical protein